MPPLAPPATPTNELSQTEPPALGPAAELGSPPPSVATISAHESPGPTPRLSGWSVTGAIGPVAVACVTWRLCAAPIVDEHGSAYQIELQHQSASDGFIWGAALEAGPRAQVFGAAALIGTGKQRRWWFWEATAGVGIEAAQLLLKDISITNSSNGGTTSETVLHSGVRPDLFARGRAAVGVPFSRSFDLVGALSVHLGSRGFDTTFAAASLGVRYRLP